MVEHDHIFKPEHADKLMSEERKKSFPADSIINKMEIKKTDVVADFGAGNGYFTIPIAQHTEETVYAIDAEPKMLDLLKESSDQIGIDTIQRITAAIEDTPIDDASVDKVLISRTIHHAPSVENTLKEIKRILKQDGSLYIIEFHKDASIEGPPMEMRISPDEMIQSLQNVGYTATLQNLNEAEYAVKAQIVE